MSQSVLGAMSCTFRRKPPFSYKHHMCGSFVADKLSGKLSDALTDALAGLGGSGDGDDYDFSIL